MAPPHLWSPLPLPPHENILIPFPPRYPAHQLRSLFPPIDPIGHSLQLRFHPLSQKVHGAPALQFLSHQPFCFSNKKSPIPSPVRSYWASDSNLRHKKSRLKNNSASEFKPAFRYRCIFI